MTPPTVDELDAALRSRARKGPQVDDLELLSDLKLVRQKMDEGHRLRQAVNMVLREAVLNASTVSCERAGPRFMRTRAQVLCFYAIFARLDISRDVERGGIFAQDRMFPAELPRDRSPNELHAVVRGFDPNEPRYPKAEMCAALALAPKGAIQTHLLMAALSIAGELLQLEEQAAKLVPGDGVRSWAQGASVGDQDLSDRIAIVEDQLRTAGLLASFTKAPPVLEPLNDYLRILEGPLRGYAEAGVEFEFVVDQLETLTSSLRGISGPLDKEIPNDKEYAQGQMEKLKEGITIKRVFIYGSRDQADVERLARQQKAEADAAIVEADTPGTYRAFLVNSGLADNEDPAKKFRSAAIIDYGEPTARVVRQFFKNKKKLDSRDVTIAPDEMKSAMRIFEHLERGGEELK